MTNLLPRLQINRLRVVRGAKVVYDQKFHEGVNIIRGQNGSGKSTISDFIFYILGGEFDDWKDAARQCTSVQAELLTSRGLLTLKRAIDTKTTPIEVFFGSMKDAENHGLDGWEMFAIRRQQKNESFSQVMFRSIGIPEAQSEGASNVTMHQLMRLCYSDQRSPAARLFRFESFDTPAIREAVGDLVCGLGGYEIYEIGLRLRELTKEHEEVRTRLNGLLKALPPDAALQTTELIHEKLRELDAEKSSLLRETSKVDEILGEGQITAHLKDRRDAHNRVSKLQAALYEYENNLKSLEFEVREIKDFQDYLVGTLERLEYAEKSFSAFGSISFTHCPACGEKLKPLSDHGQCAVCHTPTDSEKEKSRYNKIRLDLEIQTRETKHLMLTKLADLETLKQDIRKTQQEYSKESTDFEIRFSGSNGPREAYLAKRTTRIGHIDAETVYLIRGLGIAGDIDKLNSQSDKLTTEIEKFKQRENALQRQAQARRQTALHAVSDIGVTILNDDLHRQDEFSNAATIKLNFRDDAIFVDDKLNFAESSNVFLKNTAVLSLLLAAGEDQSFFHPMFLLLDNIEDKGMETERSHLFQEILVKRSTELLVPYQIIFTTSMMNPLLDLEDYTIGPSYSANQKSLRL